MKVDQFNHVSQTGFIYHHNYHFWCEVVVPDKRYRDGWYLYNDMWNNGKAEFVWEHPQVDALTHMYILLFEKSSSWPIRE